jgi:putative DNA primase/helicase
VTAEELTARLNGRQNGAGWVAPCPAHDDRRASLSIGVGDDGRVLLHCHAGCATEAVLAAAGLTYADLAGEAQPNGRQCSRIAETYDYTDESGLLLYQVCRFEPKDFRQRRPDGVGGWIPRLGDVRRVLFGLPELKGRKVAYIPEGEKDVLALRAIGLTATTNAGGAGKWREEYTEQLRAAGVRSVATLPDNDDAGRSHAEAVARSCHAAGLQVKVVMLPGLPKKGDVSNWLEAGHTRDELVTVVKATALYEPSTEIAADGKPEHDRRVEARPVITCLADVQPEPVTWLWPGRLAAGKLALLVGDPGLGKSWITLDIAARVSAGRSWPDAAPAAAPADVLLLSAEDGLADTIRPRLDALGADLKRIHHLAMLRAGEHERAIQLADTAALERAIAETGARVLTIDPMSAYLGNTDSHRDAEVRGLIAPLAALAERTGVAILGVMHLSKGTQRPALYRAIGSIAFAAAARIVLAVAADPEHDDRRIVAPIKSNLSAPPAALAYTLADGRLGWEPDPVSDVDVDVLLSGPALDKAERREADAWLRDRLADGPAQSKEIQNAAREAGLAWRTIERAKRRLGIEAELVGYGTAGRWYWRLAETATETATHREMAVSEKDCDKSAQFTGVCSETATPISVAVSVAETDDAGLF